MKSLVFKSTVLQSRVMKKWLAGSTFALVTALSSSLACADYEEGVNAAENGDYQTAFNEFMIAAEAGLDLAQYNLAILYFMGQGVGQNYETALRWTKAAAEQGHLNAQLNLGALYYNGTGTTVDFERALQWYSAAAESQQSDAQYNLATMYEHGEGTEQDLVRAYFWASAAQYNEHPGAAALIRQLTEKMSAEQISAARRSFAEWMLIQ